MKLNKNDIVLLKRFMYSADYESVFLVYKKDDNKHLEYYLDMYDKWINNIKTPINSKQIITSFNKYFKNINIQCSPHLKRTENALYDIIDLLKKKKEEK